MASNKNNQKSFLLPVQGKAILRKGSTVYFQKEVATYLSERDIVRAISSRKIANQIHCHKVNLAHGINSYCSGIMVNSLFHY